MDTMLKRDYFWNSLGVFLQSAISPILLILVTRLNGIDSSGIFSYAFSLAIIFWALGLWDGRTYQVSDADQEFSSYGYIMVRIITSVFVLITALLFSAANSYDLIKTTIIISLVLCKMLESITDALYGVFQIHHSLYKVGISLALKSVFGLVSFVLVDCITGSVPYSIVAMIATNILVIAIYDIPTTRRLEKIAIHVLFRRQHVLEAVKIMRKTWPVFIVIFLTMFSLNIPRYFLDRYYPQDVGYFGIMAMPITLLALFISFILQPNIVQLSEVFAQHNYRKFKAMVRRIVIMTSCIGIVGFIGTVFLGVWSIDLIFNIRIESFFGALLILTAGALTGAVATVYMNILIVMRRFKAQFFIFLTTNIAMALIAMPVVKYTGMNGAVMLFLATTFVQAAGLSFVYLRSINNAGNIQKMIE